MDLETLMSEVKQPPTKWDPRDPRPCNTDITAKCSAFSMEIAENTVCSLEIAETTFSHKVYIKINE